jgi:sulfur carrier protein
MPRKVKVRVKILGQKRFKPVEFSGRPKVINLLEKLGINLETAVVKLNGKVVMETERLVEGEKVEIIPIVTSG